MPQHRWLSAAVALVLLALAAPAVAQAATVSLRVEARTGSLVPTGNVDLPGSAVAPAGALDGQNCPGNSIVGALHTATQGDWNGVWSETDGWSIQRIKSQDVGDGSARKWVVYVNNTYITQAPCKELLKDNDKVLIYPACVVGTLSCFGGEPLLFVQPPTEASPGVRLQFRTLEVNTSFDASGGATSGATASVDASLFSDNLFTRTDIYGLGILTFTVRGPHTVVLQKGNRVPDYHTICITDGADGYCGTTANPHVPFDPLNFCTTTGDDGECGSPDLRAPLGRISDPTVAKKYARGKGPDTLQGTVDRDPSEVREVLLRLKRRSRVWTMKVVGKKRVTVKRRVRGKVVRKRVVRKVRKRVRVARCYQWNSTRTAWVVMKSCKNDATTWFKANGDEVWSYEFTAPLPGGVYLLDAQAIDGKGNADKTPEPGRNRVDFTVN